MPRSRLRGRSLRRAISTAYYAVFHHVSRATADRFVGFGLDHTDAYRMLYRGLDHGRMKAVCLAAAQRRTSDPDVKQFALAFNELQALRHSADYDPSVVFKRRSVEVLVALAAEAILSFDRIPPLPRTDFLALMMTKARIV